MPEYITVRVGFKCPTKDDMPAEVMTNADRNRAYRTYLAPLLEQFKALMVPMGLADQVTVANVATRTCVLTLKVTEAGCQQLQQMPMPHYVVSMEAGAAREIKLMRQWMLVLQVANPQDNAEVAQTYSRLQSAIKQNGLLQDIHNLSQVGITVTFKAREDAAATLHRVADELIRALAPDMAVSTF